MTPTPPQVPEKSQCKHPRVQMVSREEDAEFVECIECGDIFESSELEDMTIEETNLDKEL
jgi:Zn ribbon nucleic-acid-binding protein